MPVKVISCDDQLARVKRSPEEKHKRDVELLRAVCPERASAGEKRQKKAGKKPHKTRTRRGK